MVNIAISRGSFCIRGEQFHSTSIVYYSSFSMFGNAASLFVVLVSVAAVLGAPTESSEALVQKRAVVPADYLTPHNAARAKTGAK